MVILVAGATGNLGGRIVKALLGKRATVRAIVRQGANKDKVAALEKQGVQITEVQSYTVSELTAACEGVACVVSALQGLHDVIVEAQTALLDAAVASGVPRFIPSDFSTDFTDLPDGENRNFDLRKAFHQHLMKAPVKATSIFNNAFAEVLMYGSPLLNLKDKTIGFWENADWILDFTTMNDTAAYTAAVALDDTAPEVLHIASFRTTPNDLAKVAGKATNNAFTTVRMGSLADLIANNKTARAAHPEGENELYPKWQNGQYLQSMFTAPPQQLDNDRYADLQWTSAPDFIKSAMAQQKR